MELAQVHPAIATGCASLSLPAQGILSLANGETITLTGASVFQPDCDFLAPRAIIVNSGSVSQDDVITDPSFGDLKDPFYASIFPQCYALASATVVAYTLVIMLVIAPRSFVSGGVVILGRRGHSFTNGGAASNGVAVGGRPWLQKVAALTVAISLTIATADTFRVAELQYNNDKHDARDLQEEVLGGTQLKVIRLISDSFLWLAQAQTLIRLFPRQREKVIIKWTAFSLITLDILFEGLNSFLYGGPNIRPRNFVDAVPALNYLFQLSLGLLYAAWVIYYSIMKKQYAYYHRQMKNICIVAALSVMAVLVPVVFFILDMAKPEFTSWGDYVRWIGAAAASVIVWEWVERIEALEREDKKDGILGREVFDGDEMMELPSDFSWPRRRNKKKDDDGEDGNGSDRDTGEAAAERSRMWPAMSSLTSRYLPTSSNNHDKQRAEPARQAATARSTANRFLQPPLWPSRPPPAVTPISRAETTSADSTVYAIRYQVVTEGGSRDSRAERTLSRSDSNTSHSIRQTGQGDERPAEETATATAAAIPSPDQALTTNNGAENRDASPSQATDEQRKGWQGLSQMMRFRSRDGPPAEVIPHTKSPRDTPRDYENTGRWDIKARFEDFTATQAERIRERMRPTPDTENLPVTVIPAPPRRGAALAQLLEEEEAQAAQPQPQANIPDAPPSLRALEGSSRARSTPAPLSLHTVPSNTIATGSQRPLLSPTRTPGRYSDSLPSPGTPRRLPMEDAPPRSPRSGAPRRPVDEALQEEPSSPFSRQ